MLNVCLAMLLAPEPTSAPYCAVLLPDLPHWPGAAHGRWEDGQKQRIYQLRCHRQVYHTPGESLARLPDGI